jgi:FAD/FMN-containing dehydrogenase
MAPHKMSAVLHWCGENAVAVGPAAVPDISGRAVVLSLARLAQVCSVDPVNKTTVVEAGCIQQQVQEAAAGWLFPVSLAVEGS